MYANPAFNYSFENTNEMLMNMNRKSQNYFSEKLIYHGPIYRIVNLPIYNIDVKIVDQDNVELVDTVPVVPINVLLCLKFNYEI